MGTQVRITITELSKADSYNLIDWHGATAEIAPAAVVMVALTHAVRLITAEHDPDLAAEYAVDAGEYIGELIDGICGNGGVYEVLAPASVSIDLEQLESTLTLSVRPSLAVTQ